MNWSRQIEGLVNDGAEEEGWRIDRSVNEWTAAASEQRWNWFCFFEGRWKNGEEGGEDVDEEEDQSGKRGRDPAQLGSRSAKNFVIAVA